MRITSTWPFPTQESQGITSVELSPLEKINITHCMGSSGEGGVTIAWRKTSDTKNARMVEVAVAYCSPADTFTKKIGKELALDNFYSGQTVLVPARSWKSDDTIPHNLRNMFWHALNY